MSLSEERLRQIEENLTGPASHADRRMALALLAEVKRLRDAVKSQHTDLVPLSDSHERLWLGIEAMPEDLPGGLSSNGARAWLTERAVALLNPTEEAGSACRYCGEPGQDHSYPCC